MKVCSRCKVAKYLTDFRIDPRYRLGVTGWCKACKGEHSKLLKANIKLMPKAAIPEKPCSVCKTTKPVRDFHRSVYSRDGYQARCKACKFAGEVAWKMDPERALAMRLKQYGMTPADLFAMIEAQDGRCAICVRTFSKPVIDHDHETGLVRGLLCSRCNSWVAAVEDQTFVETAKAYLARPTTTFRVNQRWVEQRKSNKAAAKERRLA